MSTIRLFLERCSGIQRGQLLHFAINRDKEDVLEVIELLLDLGCPINSIMFQDDPRSWMEVKLGEPGTPLFTAVQKGKTDIVAYLLFRGADPVCPSIRGRTPLEAAESKGYTRIVDILRRYY
jgi:ankyrin repeat protein